MTFKFVSKTNLFVTLFSIAASLIAALAGSWLTSVIFCLVAVAAWLPARSRSHLLLKIFPRYRIIYVLDFGGCNWQAQKRVNLFFWKDMCGNVSSATTAAHEIQKHMAKTAKLPIDRYTCSVCKEKFPHEDVCPSNGGLADYLVCRTCSGSAQKMGLLESLKTAITTARSPQDFVFHLGYQKIEVPRTVRWHLRRTQWHRAWLGGYTGLGVKDIPEISIATQ